MSFQDFITNALFRKHFEEKLNRKRNPPAASPRTQGEIRRLIRDLLDPDEVEDASDELRAIGADAVPELLAALSNPAFRARDEENFFSSPPFFKVLSLLESFEPDRVRAELLTLADAESAEDRKEAAYWLASTGRLDVIPVLERLLQDDDGYVRSYVCSGASKALETGSEEFRERMYALIVDQCDQDWGDATNDAAETAVELAPRRAVVDLVTDRFLSPQKDCSESILEAFNRAELRIAPGPVRLVLKHSSPLATGEDCYPHDRIVAAALESLTLSVGEEIRPDLKLALNSDRERVRESAARCMARLAGLKDPIRFVLDRRTEHGFDALTVPQQTVYCGYLFEAEVCNGGLMQFFGNSSGDYTMETLRALRELGHAEAVRALEAAIEAVGPAAKHRDREERLAGFEDRFDELQAHFEPLESVFYKAKGLTARIYLYAASQPDHFRESCEVTK